MVNNHDGIMEISREGFQVVSGETFRRPLRVNMPAITLWYNSISFNKASVTALNSCERIRIEVNPNDQRILLIPVNSRDKDAVRWVMGKDLQPRKIECLRFTSQLFESWDWDEGNVYRTIGRIVSSDKKVMLLFDFSDPETWALKGKAMATKNV